MQAIPQRPTPGEAQVGRGLGHAGQAGAARGIELIAGIGDAGVGDQAVGEQFQRFGRFPVGFDLEPQIGAVANVDDIGQAAGQELVALNVAPACGIDGGAKAGASIGRAVFGTELQVPKLVRLVFAGRRIRQDAEVLADDACGVEAPGAVPLADLGRQVQTFAGLPGQGDLRRQA